MNPETAPKPGDNPIGDAAKNIGGDVSKTLSSATGGRVDIQGKNILLILILAGVAYLGFIFISRRKANQAAATATSAAAAAQPVTQFVQELVTVQTQPQPAPPMTLPPPLTGPGPIVSNPPVITPPVPTPTPTPAPVPTPTPTPAPVPTPAPTQPHYYNYTVKAGDTLAAIASRDHSTWPTVYQINKTIIDQTAIAHHEQPAPGDGYAHWIFAGEPLLLPNPLS